MENKNEDERRIAKVRCDVHTLSRVLTADPILFCPAESNAPKDLKVIGIDQTFLDYLNGMFYIFFTSKENKIIQEGDKIPEVEPFIFMDKNVKTD